MKTKQTKLKYMLPRAENILRLVASNIIRNLREGNPAKVEMAPLVQRAYTIVNETGVIPYRDYGADVVFLEDTTNG